MIDDEKGTREVLSTSSALTLAKEKEMDLVLVSPKLNPPVAKILDYGKFKYEQARKERKQQADKKVSEVKEIRLSVRMEEHDVNQRINQARRFLKEGYRVLISLRFRGRENIFRNKGLEVLRHFADQLAMDFVNEPRFAGTVVNVQLKPKDKDETKNQ